MVANRLRPHGILACRTARCRAADPTTGLKSRIGVDHKKLFRGYREDRLGAPRRDGRKRALGTRAPLAVPQGPQRRGSTEFAQDALTDGRGFRS